MTLLRALWLGLILSWGIASVAKAGVQFRPLGPFYEAVTGLAKNQAGDLLAIASGALKKYDPKENKWELFDKNAPEEVNTLAYSLAINDKDDIFVGTISRKGLFRLKGGARQWESVSSKRFHVHFISHLFVDPQDGQHLFGLRNDSAAFFNHGMYINPANKRGAPYYHHDATSFSTNPNGASGPPGGYLLESKDGGQNWKIHRLPLVRHPLRSFSIDKKGNIAIGGDAGAYYSNDGAKTFEDLATVHGMTALVQMTKDGKLVTAGSQLGIYDPIKKEWRFAPGSPNPLFLVSDGLGAVFIVATRNTNAWKQDEVYKVEDDGLEPLSKGKIRFFDAKEQSPSFQWIYCVLSKGQDQILFGSNNGVFAFENE